MDWDVHRSFPLSPPLPPTPALPGPPQARLFLRPLLATDTPLRWTIAVSVRGGGPSGQAGAAGLALARALQARAPELRPALRASGCLTVDARRRERKKPGRTRARRGRQWSKR